MVSALRSEQGLPLGCERRCVRANVKTPPIQGDHHLSRHWTVSESPIGMRGCECFRAWDNTVSGFIGALHRRRPVSTPTTVVRPESWQLSRLSILQQHLLLVYMWNCMTQRDKRGVECGPSTSWWCFPHVKKRSTLFPCQSLSHFLVPHDSDLDRLGASILW